MNTRECTGAVVRMDRRERSVVTRLHGLKHLVSLIVTALADDDTVGTLTECADQELMHRKLALAL